MFNPSEGPRGLIAYEGRDLYGTPISFQAQIASCQVPMFTWVFDLEFPDGWIGGVQDGWKPI